MARSKARIVDPGMKIVHVIPALTKGGAERVVVDLANHAAMRGDSVTIIAAVRAPSEHAPAQLSPAVEVRYVSTWRSAPREVYVGLLPWVLRNRHWLQRQDIVHCHLTFGAVFGAALQLLRRTAGSRSPVVIETYHAVGMAIPRWRRLFHSVLLRSRDAIAFMADDAYWLRFRARRPNQLSTTIPNGITAPGRASDKAAARYRSAAGIPANAVCVIGTISRLVSERRPRLLLETFANVARALGPNVHLLIGGEGPERPSLEAIAQNDGLASQIHMPGLVLNPVEPIGAVDLFITMNVGPVTGVAALEAAFLGVPVIAVQLLGDYEATPEDWIWSSPNPAEVGRKVVELLQNRATLQAIARRQRQFAHDHHGVAGMTDAYYHLYGKAILRRQRRTTSAGDQR